MRPIARNGGKAWIAGRNRCQNAVAATAAAAAMQGSESEQLSTGRYGDNWATGLVKAAYPTAAAAATAVAAVIAAAAGILAEDREEGPV